MTKQRPPSIAAYVRIGVTVAFVAGLGCPGGNKHRNLPVCAIQDCETGEIVDDGCAEDGSCRRCINDCGGRVAPRR
jgi:hypothetical protein